MHRYGYARVSSRDQNEERQLIALRRFGIAEGDSFVDKQSGKDFDRPCYQRLVKRLRRGDVLVVKSIDRLGRNYEEILAQWRYITHRRQAAIVVLDMPLLDTRNEGDATRKLISDIVLELLSYVAQTEREFIHARQAEGIAAAKGRGVRFGAKPKPRPPEFEACRALWREKQISARAAARRLDISPSTFLSWAREEEAPSPEK